MPSFIFLSEGFLLYCNMEEQLYFNPFRKHHEILLKFLETEIVDNKDKIVVCRLGDKTEHIFKNKRYLMTINWGLV